MDGCIYAQMDKDGLESEKPSYDQQMLLVAP